MSTFGDRNYIVYRSRLSQEEIYIICKFPCARTCIKEQCPQQEVLLFFADCCFDRQNEQFDQKYTEEGLRADLIFVNCISEELRLFIVRTVSLLFLGLVTTYTSHSFESVAWFCLQFEVLWLFIIHVVCSTFSTSFT